VRAVVAAGVGGWLVLRPSDSMPTREAKAWLAAWERNDPAAMTTAATGDTSSLAPAVTSMHDGLKVASASHGLERSLHWDRSRSWPQAFFLRSAPEARQ